MPEWLYCLTAPRWRHWLGGGPHGAIRARGTAYIQLHALVDQLQEDRAADREALLAHSVKVDSALLTSANRTRILARPYSCGD